jgi:nicotinate-nucleotide adenylyltransferase
VAMVKIGVMGGTFDPVHNGHITIANEARQKLDLNYVIFIPAGQPWLKAQQRVSAAADRFEMVRLAIEPYPYFKVSKIEVERMSPSYTVETLEVLKSKEGEGNQLFFLMGWDSLTQLPRWHDVTRIVGLCEIAAVPRPGYPIPDLKDLDREIPGISRHIILLDSPLVEISATDIRERVAQGRSISSLVPEAVERYISEKGLYLPV